MPPSVTVIRDPDVRIPAVLAEASFDGAILPDVGSAYAVSTGNAMSIGFHLMVPTGGTVVFEGSWNGIDWVSCTFRQMGAHGYRSTTADTHEDWIGSVASFKYVRWRVTISGSAPGEIHGKLSVSPCVIEGVEHGNEPHKIGAAHVSKHFAIATGVQNWPIWEPDDGFRICVTDMNFTVSDVKTTVIFTDGSVADGDFIFHGDFKPASGDSQFVPIQFSMPHVFTGTNALRFTQTASGDVKGVVHGYHTEV